MNPSPAPAGAISVRLARHDDISLMVRWAEAMAQETEDKQLDTATVTHGIENAIDDARRAVYFMAEIDGEPVGTMMYTREWSDWRNAWWWWIQSVYVPPEHRRKGVYRSMFLHVQELARQQGDVYGLRLYVERENVWAQRTYEQLGMHDAGYRMYEMAL
jgi:GNAT superfamily N-acetyltransferase